MPQAGENCCAPEGWDTTTVLAWLAARPHAGAPGYVACLLYRSNQDAEESEASFFCTSWRWTSVREAS